MDLGRKMEPSWHPDASKIDGNFERLIFENSDFPSKKKHDFYGSGVPKSIHKSMKNRFSTCYMHRSRKGVI